MGLVKTNVLVLLILAYGALRTRIGPSMWPRAGDLPHYLIGALALPVMDLVAMGAIALFVLGNFPGPRWVARGFAATAMLAALVSSARAAAPIVQDLRAYHRLEGAVVRKLPDQTIWIQASPRDPATSSWRVPNPEQFRRVPLRMMVEFWVAPRLGVAFVQGVLE
jgi:uncharacterized membrane protein YedE/YeeE